MLSLVRFMHLPSSLLAAFIVVNGCHAAVAGDASSDPPSPFDSVIKSRPPRSWYQGDQSISNTTPESPWDKFSNDADVLGAWAEAGKNLEFTDWDIDKPFVLGSIGLQDGGDILNGDVPKLSGDLIGVGTGIVGGTAVGVLVIRVTTVGGVEIMVHGGTLASILAGGAVIVIGRLGAAYLDYKTSEGLSSITSSQVNTALRTMAGK